MNVKHALGVALAVAAVGSGGLYLLQDNKTGELLPDTPASEVQTEHQDSGTPTLEHKSTGELLPEQADVGTVLPEHADTGEPITN